MDCIAPKIVWPHRSEEWLEKYEEKPISVPCGKCLACLSNRRNDWSFRLEMEHRYSSGALFVTLTYDPKHLPNDECVSKQDVQKFLKRLRKALYGNGCGALRYFAVGEYGSNFGRPHYHLLLFNCLDQRAISRAWCDSKGVPIGQVHYGKVTEASIAYCTKYIIQKDDYTEERSKPFTLMSRGYGIGGRYLSDEMVAWHRDDARNYAIRNGQRVRLPAFYKGKIWYSDEAKEDVRRNSVLRTLARRLKDQAFYRKKFGVNAERVMMDERDAVFARIKSKVAYTQTL